MTEQAIKEALQVAIQEALPLISRVCKPLLNYSWTDECVHDTVIELGSRWVLSPVMREKAGPAPDGSKGIFGGEMLPVVHWQVRPIRLVADAMREFKSLDKALLAIRQALGEGILSDVYAAIHREDSLTISDSSRMKNYEDEATRQAVLKERLAKVRRDNA